MRTASSTGNCVSRVNRAPERLALDEGHDVVEQAAGLTGVDEAEDMGVLEVGGDPDLGEEALGPDYGEFGPEDLDRDLALVPEVLREVDGGHAAGADLPLDAVAVSECRGEASRGVRHGQNMCAAVRVCQPMSAAPSTPASSAGR